MRARMALIRAGWEVELREVVLRDRPAHMLAVSPKGTVPVLLLADGTIIDESLDIMRQALDWRPNDLQAQWIARNDGEFKFHLDRYKYSNRYEDVDASEHRQAAARYLAELDSFLRTASSISVSLSDALFPFVRQFANHDREWFDTQPWPNIHAWLAVNLESDEFGRCMKKYRPWTKADPVVTFPPARSG
ncbi:MAG: glutathione S-transferase [Rhodothermales bacterium]|jgi:glutathione S-transferase